MTQPLSSSDTAKLLDLIMQSPRHERGPLPAALLGGVGEDLHDEVRIDQGDLEGLPLPWCAHPGTRSARDAAPRAAEETRRPRQTAPE